MPRSTWNPSGVAAWFITFSTYGSRLPGDARGSVDRHHNRPGTPLRAADPTLERWCGARMAAPEFQLGAAEADVVEHAIRQFCRRVEWPLHALAVQSNHVHPLVSSPRRGPQALSALKRAASIELRRSGLVGPDARIWTRQGSARPVWTQQEVARVTYYVEQMQDDPTAQMPWADW